MFSGIVKATGCVRESARGRLLITADARLSGLSVGDSVAVNGVCLTVTACDAGAFTTEVTPETLRRTTLGSLHAGDKVNLEPSLTLGDVVGGHLVTGHVDATGEVSKVEADGSAHALRIAIPDHVLSLVAEKGSVAVDGVSLTVTGVMDACFAVMLIPHTLQTTTAGAWRGGTRVNVEADLVARYVQRLLSARDAAAVGV